MDIVIREIEEKDYPDVASLLINELWNNKIGGDYVASFFNKARNDEHYITFVALFDNNVVGIISAINFLWAASERSHMFIQGFAVKNEYQNMGIGSKLLKHLEDYANAKGVTGIGLCSGFKRTAAHGFYEKNGYSSNSQYFGKMLNPIKQIL